MPSNEITVEEWDKLPSPVEINKALCVLCSKNLEAAPEIKKGVHFECAVTELHTEYNLPCCENCGNVLTIRDPIADSDGQSLLCRQCELLAGYKAGTSICFASGRNYGASFMRALKERSMLDPDAPDAIAVATDQKDVKWLHNHLKKS